MNLFLKISRLIVLSAIILLLSQCKKKNKSIDPAFTGYVSAFSSGVVSNESTILIRLVEEVPGKEANMPEDEDLFDFSPSIKGVTYWKDNRTIIFDPDETLPSDKLFDVRFNLSKIIDIPRNLKTFEFQFRTMKQAIKVKVNGLKTYNNTDLSRQQLTGKIITSDLASNNKIETILNATQNSNQLEINWEHSANGKIHNYTIENVVRGEKRSKVILEWDGKPIGSDDSSDESVIIPPLGEFSVFDIEIIQQPHQCITVYFTDPINPDQELNGLIHLKNGTDVQLVAGNNEIKVYPESRITKSTQLIIEQGIKNILDYRLNKKFIRDVKFSSIKPKVELIGDGVILPNSNGLVFPFRAVNLSGVNVKIIKIFEDNIAQFFQTNQYNGNRELRRVGRIVYKEAVKLISDKAIDLGEWNTFSLDLSELINTEPGAIYRVHLSFDQSQSLYPCTEDSEQDDYYTEFDEDKELALYDEPKGGYYYYDDYYYGNYNWNDRNNPCKKSYYMRNNNSVARNVLASDIGLIVKSNNNNELKVVATNIITTDPLNDVKLEIYNYQNQLIADANTDSKGFATIHTNSKGFLLVARKNNQRGYLRIDDGSALSLSMFDVGGQKLKKGIKGYIYGERGVWRPGDSIYVQFILEDKNNSLPPNHPVVFELFTPENQLYKRKIKTTSLNGFYDFRTTTKKEDPTGNWMTKIKVGGATFTRYLKIETVKPNRLKINLDFGSDILKSGKNQNGTLEVKWLHGAKAKNIKSDIEISLSKGKTTFKNFKDFNFDDPAKNFEAQNKTIYDGELDENGKANFNVPFNIGSNAPGMLKAKFRTRAFEHSGDFSTDVYTLNYSPYKSYVGIKVPQGPGWNGALYSNEPNLIPIVTVDENGNPVDREKVKIEIFEIRWRWWWEHSDDFDLGRYVSGRSSNRIYEGYINTKAGKAMFEMNLNINSWGRKLIRVTDPVSKHSTGQIFYTTYKGWWNSSDSQNTGGAEMLNFNTDKKKYNIGDIITVSLPETGEGKALVSLETGSKIIETFWINPDETNHTFSFKASEAMSPNVYLHVSFIQPHIHKNNDLPIRLYGVQPVMVENPDTHLQPVIDMPDVLQPEKEVTVKVREANGKKMTYTVAVVDEGLLDLTRFTTPNAWSKFYAREALGVKTWDLYKYIIGAYSGEMAGLLAIGGDEDLIQQGDKKANRFKPVVKFMGPFELKSGTNTHKFIMPNYIGSVRTMVIAGQNGAYGAAEKTTPVKKPLMVMATLPRVVGPTEKVKLPVTVFAMDRNIKNVSLSVKTNSLLKVVNNAVKNVQFTEEGEQTIDFEIDVLKNIGVGTVKVTAASGKEKSTYEIEIDVRIPNPPVTNISDAVIEPGKNWQTNYKAIGIIGTNTGVIEVSSIPPLNLKNRLQYLIQYPHGCIEQTISAVFPQLYLNQILEVSEEQQTEIENNIKAGIDNLKKFQLNNGGLSYWPGESGHASDWGTNYAGHFLLEAKAKGYSLPPGLLKKWIKFQTSCANDWSVNSSENTYHFRSSQLIQAYRLFTLALAGKPALGAMNRLREAKSLTMTSKWRLAAAYKLIGRDIVAKELIEDLPVKVDKYRELSYSYGSNIRDEAMILETLVLLKKTGTAKKVLNELSEHLNSQNWMSTQTTAYCLLSIAKFIGVTGAGSEIDYTLTLNGNKESINTSSAVSQQKIDIENTPEGTVRIVNNSNKMLFVKLQLSGIPLIGDKTDSSNDLVMSVKYTDLKNNPIDISNLEQGTDFIAEVKISHPGIRSNYKEIALTQIFPSGWEVRNLRLEENTSINTGDQPRYQDIRDDRIYTYFNVEKGNTKTYRVLLNATYAGRFYMPTVYCEAMYDNEINAQKAGKWVEVVKTEQ